MKKYVIGLLVVLIGAAAIGYYNYQKIFQPNVGADTILYIPTGSSFSNVVEIVSEHGVVKNLSSFETVASWMNYNKESVPAGKYIIKQGWNNKLLISKLRSGDQTPVKATINNVREIEDFCGKLSSYLEMDSLQLLQYLLNEEVLASLSCSKDDILTQFIPNTYEVWWDITPEDLTKRLVKESNIFWDKAQRSEKAENKGLSKKEVYILASIVEKETQLNEEKPRIAGVYLNRLRKGMHLQADPTVVYATREFDLKRVLHKHLAFDSPYNTYKYAGLPPGPIYMPEISSIDAVLNAENHNYLYFCASPDHAGAHLFATNLVGHNRNAQRYWNWLRKKGIK